MCCFALVGLLDEARRGLLSVSVLRQCKWMLGFFRRWVAQADTTSSSSSSSIGGSGGGMAAGHLARLRAHIVLMRPSIGVGHMDYPTHDCSEGSEEDWLEDEWATVLTR